MSQTQTQEQRPPLNSLATKIILFVFLATFATAIAVSWVAVQSTHASLQSVVDHLYPLALEHASRSTKPWLESAAHEVEILEREIRPQSTIGELHTALSDVVRNSEHLEGLIAFYGSGDVRAKAGALPDHTTWPQVARVFAAGSHGVSAVTLPDESTRMVAWASHGGAGVVGFIDRAALSTLLERALPDSASSLSIVDGSGRILLSTDPAPPSHIDLAVTGASDKPTAQGYDIGRKHMVGVSKPLGVGDLHAVVQAPFEAAFAPMLTVVTRIFLIDLVIILFFTLLSYRVTSKVIQPIEDLSESARRIAQGHTETDIPESGSRDEIGLLTCTFNDMMRQLRTNQEEIESANQSLTDRNSRLQQLNEVLSQLSITDGLTKLHNHRFFQDHLTREIKRVNRTREPLSMLLIDIDDFKQLNDRFGHAAGDELLSRLAKILNDAVRESDLLARYGGEEFVILAATTDLEGAYQLAEKVRTEIAEASFILDDSLRPKRVTVSIGVAQFSGNRKRFFQETDQALYQAKAAGKNCVILHEDEAAKRDSNA